MVTEIQNQTDMQSQSVYNTTIQGADKTINDQNSEKKTDKLSAMTNWLGRKISNLPSNAFKEIQGLVNTCIEQLSRAKETLLNAGKQLNEAVSERVNQSYESIQPLFQKKLFDSQPTKTDNSSLSSSHIDLNRLPTIKLSKGLELYNPDYKPLRNLNNLLKYFQSKDYKRHCKSARIYFNLSELSERDSLEVIFRRVPTNIAQSALYVKSKLKKLFGYENSAYNDTNVKKEDGTSFNEKPNTVCVYSENYLWHPPGGKSKVEVACLSLPAPALDAKNQPHYKYYVEGEGENATLNVKKYEQEMKFLFKTIEMAVKDNKDSAFEGKGIKRLVLTKFGQANFISTLSKEDRLKANDAYKKEMATFLSLMEQDIPGLEIVMSEYLDTGNPNDKWHENMIYGDILTTAKEGDLIINPWDPHSAPGNGNDGDASFDGAMGKGSTILPTQSSWFNKFLRSKKACRGVNINAS